VTPPPPLPKAPAMPPAPESPPPPSPVVIQHLAGVNNAGRTVLGDQSAAVAAARTTVGQSPVMPGTGAEEDDVVVRPLMERSRYGLVSGYIHFPPARQADPLTRQVSATSLQPAAPPSAEAEEPSVTFKLPSATGMECKACEESKRRRERMMTGQ